MRAVYLWLARLIGVLVAVQAALMVYAISQLIDSIKGGAVINWTDWSDDNMAWRLHGVVGQMVVPVVIVVFLVVAFLCNQRVLVIFAVVEVVLVLAQVAAGMLGEGSPAVGAFHGFNAFLMFGAATAAAMTAKKEPGAA